MNKSNYFVALSTAYLAEIDNLACDYEGKAVLAERLREKRQEIDTMMQMIDSAPEMVAPIFHGAFAFLQSAVMIQAMQAEPDDEDFPEWNQLAASIRLSDWATPIARRLQAEPGGDRFMVSAAVVEFLRLREFSSPAASEPVESGNKDDGESDDGADQDLAEAGADWLSEQGFDSHSA